MSHLGHLPLGAAAASGVQGDTKCPWRAQTPRGFAASSRGASLPPAQPRDAAARGAELALAAATFALCAPAAPLGLLLAVLLRFVLEVARLYQQLWLLSPAVARILGALRVMGRLRGGRNVSALPRVRLAWC